MDRVDQIIIEEIRQTYPNQDVSEAVKLDFEKWYVQEAMCTFGGSFFRGIGEALRHADMGNITKIKRMWPYEWRRYLEMGVEMEKGKQHVE